MICSVFVFIYAQGNWSVTNGEFGDLLSGTVGVGASIGAMFFIIITLMEQRKMNKQIEVHHLVESYNSVFDRLMHLLNGNSEVEKTPTKVKDHLGDLWNKEYGIQSFLNCLTDKLRENTYKEIELLQGLCQDEDLIRISCTLNRLLSIKCRISELDIEAGKRVDDDWQSISITLKKYAGFYFGWHSYELLNVMNGSIQNEMVALFSKDDQGKLIAYIPRINFYKQEEIFKLNKDEFAQQLVQVDLKNDCYDVTIMNIKLSETPVADDSAKFISIPINLIIKPHSSNQLSFNELFKDKVETVFKYLTSQYRDKSYSFYQDIKLKYRDKEWIYENKIEINPYPNNHASILLHEITE